MSNLTYIQLSDHSNKGQPFSERLQLALARDLRAPLATLGLEIREITVGPVEDDEGLRASNNLELSVMLSLLTRGCSL